jgi:tetratricopeptide (TPR) repeat protein
MVLTLRAVFFSWLVIALTSCTGNSPEGHLKRAEDYLKTGQYRKAEHVYKEVLKTDPGNSLASQKLAVLYFDQGQLRQAYPLLQKSVEADRDNVDLKLKLKLATAYFIGRDFAKARELAREIIDKHPDNQEAVFLIIDTAVSQNELEQTRGLVDRLRSSEKGSVTYHLARGALELRQNNADAAEQEFRAALYMDPKSSAAYSSLGTLYWTKHEIALANEAMKNAAELTPAGSSARVRYIDFKLRTGAVAEAKKSAEEMLHERPEFLPPRVYLMKILCAENLGKDCATEVDKLLADDSLNYDALYLRGRLSLAKNEATPATRIFEQLRTMNDRDARVRFQLALAYIASTNGLSPNQARQALENAENNLNVAIQLEPKFDQAAVLLADLKIQKRSFATAIDILRPIVNGRSQMPQAHYLLAAAHLAQQQQDQALTVYRGMSELFPNDPEPPFLISRILLGQGQLAAGRAALEKSVERADYLPAIETLVNLDIADKQYGAASERVQKLIDKSPNEAQAWAIRAKIDFAQRDVARAESALQKAIQLNPELESAYRLLAQVYLATGRQEEAIKKLTEAVEKQKDNQARTVPALLQLALLQHSAKRSDAAIVAYEKVLDASPTIPLALNNLAFLYSERGQIDKAFELAKKANEVSPNDPNIADTLGWIQLKKGEYGAALALLQNSAAKLSESPEIQFHLGMAHYMMGDEASARAALRKAVESNSDFERKDDARRRLAILSIDSRAPEAERGLDSYLRDEPNDPMALLRRGELQERQGASEQAIKTYERIVQINPQFGPALRRLATAYARSNELAKATDAAQKARQTHPDDPRVADLLGWIEFKNGAYHKALPLLMDSAARLPDEPEVQFHLGMTYYMMGEEEPARAALHKAVGAAGDFPDKSEAHRRLAVLSRKDADGNTFGRSELERFLREDPKDPFALFRLAQLQQHETIAEAIRTYEKILINNPDFSPALRQAAILYGQNTPPDLNKALEIATRARRAYPSDLEITRTLGILNYRRGFYPQAAEQLKSAAATRKDDPELLYYLGETFYQLKQSKDCREAMESALSLNLASHLVDMAKRVRADCAENSSNR